MFMSAMFIYGMHVLKAKEMVFRFPSVGAAIQVLEPFT